MEYKKRVCVDGIPNLSKLYYIRGLEHIERAHNAIAPTALLYIFGYHIINFASSRYGFDYIKKIPMFSIYLEISARL